MNVAIVASECAPFAKTGGLADVIGTLPKYLARRGADVKVFIPKFRSIDEKKFTLQHHKEFGVMPVRVAGIPRPVAVWSAALPDSAVPVYFIECKEYFDREEIYTDDPDEDERWILFCKAVIETLQRLHWSPDVVHGNDWQTGLLPLLMKDNYGWDRMFSLTSFLYSIHNIGYQGRFSPVTGEKAELRGDLFAPDGPITIDNSLCMMKAGIYFSETLSTVSETYAGEILTDAYGGGMQHILRTREHDLTGILNGIDTDEWNPETDRFIPHHYSVQDLSGKKRDKQFLLEKTSIPFDERKPLIGIISRLVAQKGFDLIEESIDALMALEAQWVILGTGEERYERLFKRMGNLLPQQCWTYVGFNNELAHLIEAGADLFIMPSHYEPCGLNQMYSLRYGTVPVVRATGGLKDTVRDWHHDQNRGNGFVFDNADATELAAAVTRAVATYARTDVWTKIQQNGMADDNSWEHAAQRYMHLYGMTVSKRKV